MPFASPWTALHTGMAEVLRRLGSPGARERRSRNLDRIGHGRIMLVAFVARLGGQSYLRGLRRPPNLRAPTYFLREVGDGSLHKDIVRFAVKIRTSDRTALIAWTVTHHGVREAGGGF